MRRALGIRRSWRQKVAPFVLLGVVTIPAIVNVGIGYVTRDQLEDRIEIITYRDYVGVSSALLLFVALVAPDVMCPDRRQRVLPLMFARPLTGRRLRGGQGGRDRLDPVRVLVPAAGRAVRRQHARQRQRARLLHRPPRRAVEGAGRRSCCWPCTTPSSASPSRRSPIAGSSPARRSIGLFLVTSIASGIIVGEDFEDEGGSVAALINVLASCRCTCATSCSSVTSIPESPLTGVDNGGLFAVVTYRRRARRRRRRAAAPLPLGGALMSSART